MLKKPIIILGLLMLFCLSDLLYAQTLYVKKTDATQESIQLDDIRKITFPSNQIKLTKQNNQEVNFEMISVSYLSFTNYDSSEIVSIKPTINQSELTIELGPNNDYFEINYISNTTQMGYLEILDALGKKVLSFNKQLNKGANSVIIDISSLANGVYLSRILVDDRHKSFKLVKGK